VWSFDITYQLRRRAGGLQAFSALFGQGLLTSEADEKEGGQPSRSETLGSETDEWGMRQQQAEAEPQATSVVSEFCPEPSGQSRPARNRVAGAFA